MKARLHALAGGLALLCIAGFWTSTAVSEIFLSGQAVAQVKHGILLAMWVMVPAMAATGASGFRLARRRSGRIVERKARRMRAVALNGLLVLLPAAYYLAYKAGAYEFDRMFAIVQTAELVAGAINLSLIVANLRDGLRLSGRAVP